MTKQVINIGTAANSRNGDPLRTAFTKTNQNFTELYTAVGTIPSDVSDLTDTSGLLGDNTGNVVFDGNQLYVGGTGFLNLDNANNQVEIGSNGSYPLLISVNEGDKAWVFDTSGSVTLPAGGDILDSEGNSVLGGTTGDSNVWIQTFESVDGAPTDVPALTLSVEYDSEGNVIALFTHYNNNDNSSYYSVGKYTTAGAKIWTARFSDNINTDGWGLAVDNDTDTIYVAGQTTTEGPGYSVSTLTKLDATDGSVLWSKTYDFGYESTSAVVDVASDGNPVMVGYAYNVTDRYVTTTKVSAADGSITWTRSLNGQNDEEAYGMAVGPDGEIVVTGYMSQLGFGVNDAAASLTASPTSNANWVTPTTVSASSGVTFDITLNAGVATLTVVGDTTGGRTVGDAVETVLGSALGGTDGIDDMIVTVASVTAVGSQDDHMLVVKYDSVGAIQWQKAILFDVGFDCNGADADVDSMGNIYVTGSYQYDNNGSTTSALSILKLDGNGAKQWSRRVQGDCETFGISVVVGADDKLYLSGMTGNNAGPEYIWVAAKYDFNGLVEWQRLIDNTTGWTFAGGLFTGNGGGSNIAVKSGYVVLGGGFGDLINSGVPQATVVQVSAAGDVFSVGDWDFKAASFSGVLNGTASDITVINAGKTDTDNSSSVTTSTVTLNTEVANFLLGTLYSEAVGNDRLVNSGSQLVLSSTGTVTLPLGGTITEGVVTSNPTIQLTPASPDVTSQKLVIKGGGSYNFFDNGINLNYYNNTAIVGDTVTFYVNSDTYADQTLYWWIYPTGANLATPNSGTVLLTGNGYGNFNFILDSDDYEFTVRVSPEADNYDPANVGVESGAINAGAPTYGDHHLHLTTGDLSETSIFLGTDNHNVRTTTDGKIQITTPNTVNNVWEFGPDGTTTFPTLTVPISDNATPSGTGQTLKFGDTTQQAIIYGPASTSANNDADRIIIQGAPGFAGTTGEGGDVYLWAGPGGDVGGNGGDIKIRAGRGILTGNGGYLNFQAGSSVDGSGGYINIESGASNYPGAGGDITVQARDGGTIQLRTYNSEGNSRDLVLDNAGTTTLPGAVVKSTVAKTGIANGTGTATALSDATYSLPIVDGNYGPFTRGPVTFTVVVTSGVAAYTVVSTTGNNTVGDVIGTLGTDDLGGAPGNISNISVSAIQQAFTPIDLTRSVNKLSADNYSLADGVEGQILYLVRQTGANPANIGIFVNNARVNGAVASIGYVPFGVSGNMATLIFTDSAWQSDNGTWD